MLDALVQDNVKDRQAIAFALGAHSSCRSFGYSYVLLSMSKLNLTDRYFFIGLLLLLILKLVN